MTTPTEQQELIDAELAIEGMRTPNDEYRLRSLIRTIPGIDGPTLYGALLALQYDPISTTKIKICDALVGAGFGVSILRLAPVSQ